MKKTVSLGLGLAAVLAGGMTAGLSSAGAATDVRPAHAPLLDAAGIDSGCVQSDPKMGVRQNAAGELVITKGTNMVCDRQYAKRTVKTGFWEIMPDGTRVVVDPFSEVARGSAPAPGTLDASRGGAKCADFPGTHTFIARSTWKVKVTKDSTNPFSATTERVSTVTCPG